MVDRLNRQLRGWAAFYKYTDFTATTFRHVDHVVFWKMAHWLARKHRSRIKPLMRSYYRASVVGQSKTGLSTGSVNEAIVSGKHCTDWYPVPKGQFRWRNPEANPHNFREEPGRPSPRDIRMSQWPWARLEWRAVCAERCPYDSGRRSAHALLTPFPMARGFVYLAVVLEWATRRVLSWRLSITPVTVSRRYSTPTRARASPAAAASGPWKSRLPIPPDCMAATWSGRMSCSGCSTTPASSAPAGMKKAGAGRRSRRRSRSGFADPISLRLDVRMAPKFYPTPLSGGDRKALTKELGKARAMANILAAQSAEIRAKGEAVIQQADRLLLRELERADIARQSGWRAFTLIAARQADVGRCDFASGGGCERGGSEGTGYGRGLPVQQKTRRREDGGCGSPIMTLRKVSSPDVRMEARGED